MQHLKDYGVWLGLVITLLLVYVVDQQEGEDDLLVSQQKSKRLINTSGLQVDVSTDNERLLLRKRIVDKPINLFSVSHNVQVEQMYEYLPSEPETPVSPYRYVGKLVEGEEVIVFLTDGRKNYSARSGDILDENWKVKFIHPPEMVLQFLPLNTQVSVQVGALF
ncbi:MAG: hypothetical protein ACSHWN_11390 [Methylophilaceae bacterium]